MLTDLLLSLGVLDTRLRALEGVLLRLTGQLDQSLGAISLIDLPIAPQDDTISPTTDSPVSPDSIINNNASQAPSFVDAPFAPLAPVVTRTPLPQLPQLSESSDAQPAVAIGDGIIAPSYVVQGAGLGGGSFGGSGAGLPTVFPPQTGGGNDRLYLPLATPLSPTSAPGASSAPSALSSREVESGLIGGLDRLALAINRLVFVSGVVVGSLRMVRDGLFALAGQLETLIAPPRETPANSEFVGGNGDVSTAIEVLGAPAVSAAAGAVPSDSPAPSAVLVPGRDATSSVSSISNTFHITVHAAGETGSGESIAASLVEALRDAELRGFSDFVAV